MAKISRRISRMCLVQMIYSRYFLKESFEEKDFLDAFFVDKYRLQLDMDYINSTLKAFFSNEKKILKLISKLAPKFRVETIPAAHISILSVAITELLFIEESIPEKIIINEAIELCKRFSDNKGKIFVNGVLHSVTKLNKDDLI